MLFSFSRNSTGNDTGMPPLEIRLVIRGIFILLAGVIIANVDQIQFTPQQAQHMGWRPSLLLLVLINTVTVVHSTSYKFEIDGSTGILGEPAKNLTMTITGNHTIVKLQIRVTLFLLHQLTESLLNVM